MSKAKLKTTAGLIWVASGAMLLYRGAEMIRGVWTKNPELLRGIEKAEDIVEVSSGVLIFYVMLGLLFGGAKGLFVLSKSAKRNIDRIDRLEHPKPWQVFSAKFYPLIAVMIAMGWGFREIAMSNEGWKSNFSYAGCGAVYIGIGAALFASSLAYLKKKIEPA